MQGHTSGNRALYRCRYPEEYARTRELDHPRNIYVREDHLVPALDGWLAQLFDDENLDSTCEALAMAQDGHDDASAAKAGAARRKLDHCDARLAKYRAALEADADPVIVAGWMAEVRGERATAERDLADARPAEPMTDIFLRAGLGGVVP